MGVISCAKPIDATHNVAKNAKCFINPPIKTFLAITYIILGGKNKLIGEHAPKTGIIRPWQLLFTCLMEGFILEKRCSIGSKYLYLGNGLWSALSYGLFWSFLWRSLFLFSFSVPSIVIRKKFTALASYCKRVILSKCLARFQGQWRPGYLKKVILSNLTKTWR